MSAVAEPRAIGARAARAAAGLAGGIAAVTTKELRGRMRGGRAFLIVTVYLMLLALFAYGILRYETSLAERAASAGGLVGWSGGAALSARVGQAIFAGLLALETLLVLVLAPAFTSGALSMEREKQTLDLLVTTPLSSLALVLGKLVSALAYVFLLILASIPLASIVFTFGGVGPEDIVRAYLLLFALAFGLGAIGLFISALVRRTQLATVLTYVTVLALTIGSGALWVFLYVTERESSEAGVRAFAHTDRPRPPETLLLLNPVVADLDLICTTYTTGPSEPCAILSRVTGREWSGGIVPLPAPARGVVDDVCIGPDDACPQVAPTRPEPDCPDGICEGGGDGSSGGKAILPIELQAPVSGFPRDTFWPRSALAFTITGVALTALATQLVSPTRRVALLRPGDRLARRRAGGRDG